MVVGMDLGNGYCKMAVISVTGNAVIVTNSRSENVTPSVIFWDGSKWLVGAEALNALLAEPDKGVGAGVGFKRHMGTDTALFKDSGGKVLYARDMARIILEHLRAECEKALGEPVNEVIISVPANYDDRQKAETLTAAAEAGLKVLKLVHEPTAALFGAEAHKKGDGGVAIVDIGCGTSDISYGMKSGNNFSIMVTNGDPRLGGLDYDARIQDLVLKRFEEKHGFRPDPDKHAQAFADIRARIEGWKVSLSTRDSVAVTVSAANKVFTTTITRGEFEAVTKDLTDRVVELTAKTIKEAGIEVGQLREFILAGGGAQVPAIGEALEKRFGRKPAVVGSPALAIAKGAALMGRLFLEESGQTVRVGKVALPPLNLHSRDVTGKDYGVAVLAGEAPQPICSVLLHKGVPIPSDNTRRYHLARDGQTECLLQVLSGPDNAPIEQCLSLGQAELTGLPAVSGEPHNIEVRFKIDNNGMLTATAYDPRCGKSAKVEIHYDASKAPSPGDGAGQVPAPVGANTGA